MAVGARGGAGDPLADAVVQRGLAVERGGGLQAHPGAAAAHARHEADVELVRFGCEQSVIGDDAGGAQSRHALSRHQRVRVLHRADDAGDAGRDQRVGARWRTPVVRTRLEGDVSGGAPGGGPGGAQGVDFRVRLARSCVPAFADDVPVVHQHAADAWVGRGRGQAARGKLQRTRHRRMVSCRKGHAPGRARACRSCCVGDDSAPRGSPRRTHPRRRSCDTPTRIGCRRPCRAS